MAEALYRKYRPQIFEDVVGQEHIERTIKNAIEQDKVSHAYLFTGPRGTGKTTTARLLAKALLCEKGPTAEPDGTCADCEMIANGEHPDVYELDAASRTGVENVREEIIGRVQFAPTRGRYKIYIIDEVHMLSTAAFNALLKTLEEPPDHVVFILATTDPQKVPETIHSRCQRFDFRRISSEAMVSRLGAICVAEGVEFEGEALDLIAHRADGGLRNALTSLEQLIAFGEGCVTMEVAERMLGSLDVSDLGEIVRLVGTRDVAGCFRWTADYVETGADLAQFTRDFAEHVRNMYVMSLAGTDVALDVGESVRRELEGELALFGPDRLARLLGVLGDLSAELKTSTNPRLSFEIALTRMVRPDSDLTLESLAERIEALESGHSAVAHVVSSGAVVGAGAMGAAGVASADASASAGAAGGAPMRAQAASAEVCAAGGVPAQASVQAQARGAAVAGSSLGGAAGNAVGAVPAHTANSPTADTRGSGAASADGNVVCGAAANGVVSAARAIPSESRTASEASTQAQRAVSQGMSAGVSGGVSSSGAAEAAASAANSAGSASASLAGVESAGSAASPASASAALSPQLVESFRNPAALQRIWQTALATLKKAKAAYGVLFLNTKAVFDEATQSLMVEFPAENDFAFKAVQKPDVQDELSAALVQACGASVPFRLTKAGSAGGSVASAVASVLQQRQPEPQQREVRLQAQSQAQPTRSHVQPAAQPQVGAQSHPQMQPQPAASVDTATHSSPDWLGSSPTGYNPAYDEVPVDAYDDVVPYDDYDPGMFEEPAPARSQQFQPAMQPAAEVQPQAQQEAQSRPGSGEQPQGQVRSAAQPQQGAARDLKQLREQQPAAQSQPVVQPRPQTAGEEPSLTDLDAALAFGFGCGAHFTEVRE